MNLKDSLIYSKKELANLSSSSIDAQILIEFVLKKPRSFLFSHPEYNLTKIEQDFLFKLVKRRKNHEPIAYITGQKEFWSLNFKVTEDTLIPRSETEILVEQAISIIQNKLKSHKINILELGTGTGAISVAIAAEFKDLVDNSIITITATDISTNALEVAKYNAAQHKLKINFIKSNWFENIINQKFDLIISNPPYIEHNSEHVNLEAKFEPKLALYSDNQGLADLKKIIKNSTKFLIKGGCLLLEHGFDQANALQNIAKQYNFKAQTYQDLAKLDRMTKLYS